MIPSVLKEIFSDLNEKDFSDFTRLFKETSISKSSVVWKQGESITSFLIVLSGTLLEQREFEPYKITLDRIEKGNACGYLSLLDGAPSASSVIAEQNTIIAEMSYEDFQNLVSMSTPLAVRFQKYLATEMTLGLRRANRRFTVAATLPSDEFTSKEHLSDDIRDCC